MLLRSGLPRLMLDVRENSVSPGGISSVVHGYLCLDGGAAQVRVGKVSFTGTNRSHVSVIFEQRNMRCGTSR